VFCFRRFICYMWTLIRNNFCSMPFKILSAVLRASASNVGKMTKIIFFFQFFWESSSLRIYHIYLNLTFFEKNGPCFFQKLALITKKCIHYSHFCSCFLVKLPTGPYDFSKFWVLYYAPRPQKLEKWPKQYFFSVFLRKFKS
jgi:hypothetical protein